jgi:hypothetical protein
MPAAIAAQIRKLELGQSSGLPSLPFLGLSSGRQCAAQRWAPLEDTINDGCGLSRMSFFRDTHR